jgi:fucose permease
LIFFDILVFMKINDAQQTGRIRLSTFGKLTGRYFIIIAVAMFVYMGIEEGAAFWTGEYITAFGGSAFSGNTFGAEISPYFLSVYWFGMAVSRFAASFIKKRVILFCIVSVTVGLAAFLLLLNINNAFIMLTCFAAIGFGIAPVWPLCMALAVKSSPLTPNAAAGVVSAVGSGGAAAIPFALGIAADKFGIKSAFGFIAALVAAMLGLLFLLSRSDLIKNKAKSEGEK